MDEKEKLRLQKELEELKKKQEESSKKDWVEVYKIFDLVEAPIVEDILNKNDIPTDTYYFDAAPVYLVYSTSKEKGIIRVEKKYEEKAHQIIRDFEENKNKPP
ncbi:MAG: hypothetical protein JSW40_05990 [Candidatus Omnitrophota bacterium]|nr:MAG: hypothetical protein JSW40_05990 [Candidatus Omnitrophota bacterium]